MEEILIAIIGSSAFTVIINAVVELIKNRSGRKAKNDKAIKELADSVKALTDRIDQNEAMTSRYRIIRAANEITNGMKPTADTIEQLQEDLNVYDTWCAKNPLYQNHKGKNSRRIVLEYEEKMLGGNKT